MAGAKRRASHGGGDMAALIRLGGREGRGRYQQRGWSGTTPSRLPVPAMGLLPGFGRRLRTLLFCKLRPRGKAPRLGHNPAVPPVRFEAMNILLIEDDAETAALIGERLRGFGHTVEVAADGRRGLARASRDRYEVMIVDRMLPGIDGLSIVGRIRAAGIDCPVLMLTTLSGIEHRVEGLDAGADDYLVKPFAFDELLARVHALGRRPPLGGNEALLRVGDLQLDRLQRRVTRAGRPIELQPQEFKLLEFLMRHSSRVVTRAMLLEGVWGFHFDPRTTVVETHISRLRAKIDRDFDVELLQTVRGAGYRLSATG